MKNGGAGLNRTAEQTCLFGTEYTSKAHPRIALRGALDGLHAQGILCAVIARREGHAALSLQAEQIAQAALCLLSAEYSGHPVQLPAQMDLEQAHTDSHAPKQAFGVDHFYVTTSMGETMAHLNLLRTRIRDCERLAVHVFGQSRLDIVQALNRLSSLAYCLMCQLRAEQEADGCR